MKKQKLTNEILTKLFRNNFELALYAMEIARRNIKAGKEFTLETLLTEVQNHPLKGDLEELLAANRREDEARAAEDVA